MRMRPLLVVPAAALLSLALVAPASAASQGGTTVSLTILGGSLSITMPAAARWTPLGGKLNKAAQLGEIQVNDNRAVMTGWVASLTPRLFMTAGDGTSRSAPTSYGVGALTQRGQVRPTPAGTDSAQGLATLVSATQVSGDSSAAWTPSLTVELDGHQSGTSLTGLITHSVD